MFKICIAFYTGSQKSDCRPTPGIVALVDVGAAVLVDADRNEVLFNLRYDFRIGEGGCVEFPAKRTPGGDNVEQDGEVAGAGLMKGIIIPVQPLNLFFTCHVDRDPYRQYRHNPGAIIGAGPYILNHCFVLGYVRRPDSGGEVGGLRSSFSREASSQRWSRS